MDNEQKLNNSENKTPVFSQRVSLLLKLNGISQKKLAIQVGVTESAMSYYVRGSRTPRGAILLKIAKALNSTIDYLLDNSLTACLENPKSNISIRNNEQKLTEMLLQHKNACLNCNQGGLSECAKCRAKFLAHNGVKVESDYNFEVGV